MTTAHRPTWAPAMGHEEQGGVRMHVPSMMQSAKDMPSQTTLKYRRAGQATEAEVKQADIRADLERRERKHFKLDKLTDFEEQRAGDQKLLESAPAVGSSKARGLVPNARDADDVDAESDSEGSEDDSDEDDMAALEAELEKIKQEKAAQKAKEAAEAEQKAEQDAREDLIKNNPALRRELGMEEEPSFQMKRRWDDDVVFKNQARTEPKKQKRFINDTVRSDFHRRFLDRYIK